MATTTAGATRQTRIEKALAAAYHPESATGGEDTVKIRVCAGIDLQRLRPRRPERRP